MVTTLSVASRDSAATPSDDGCIRVVRPYRVSTVFLSLDHSFTAGYGPPLLFETMVFGPPPDEWADLLCRRYSTWNEAVEGHAAVVAEVIVHV